MKEDTLLLDEPNGEKGYVIAVCDDSEYYIPDALHIERNDSLNPWIYKNDIEAAKGAEQDGVKLIYGMEHVENGVYVDTPENRETIIKMLELYPEYKEICLNQQNGQGMSMDMN